LTYEKSIRFYSIADLVIMPSMADSNPLSLIEAIHSSLPILISNRVGNKTEVLLEGENGYSCDPENAEDLYSISYKMFNLSKNDLALMGEKSKILAKKYFDSKSIIKTFFDSI
jgi:glycosyltransferase involved in cell wall biosynthesis